MPRSRPNCLWYCSTDKEVASRSRRRQSAERPRTRKRSILQSWGSFWPDRSSGTRSFCLLVSGICRRGKSWRWSRRCSSEWERNSDAWMEMLDSPVNRKQLQKWRKGKTWGHLREVPLLLQELAHLSHFRKQFWLFLREMIKWKNQKK